MRKVIVVITSFISIIVIAILILYIVIKSEGYTIRFPLAEVYNDDAEYVLVKYGTDGIYVIDDESFLSRHRFDSFIIFPEWLNDSTGDGYFRVKKDGETIFICDFIDDKYFDAFICNRYIKYESTDEYMEDYAEQYSQ